MTLSRNGLNGWTAKLAALLFAVQAALAAFSLGAVAAPLTRDQFGNVLCQAVDHAQHSNPAGREGRGHEGKLDCCHTGCLFAGERVVPPDAVVAVELRLESAADLAMLREPALQPSKRIGEKRARAPPKVDGKIDRP